MDESGDRRALAWRLTDDEVFEQREEDADDQERMWRFWSFGQYYEECCGVARSLIEVCDFDEVRFRARELTDEPPSSFHLRGKLKELIV